MFFTLFVTYWHVEFAIMLFVKVMRALMMLFLLIVRKLTQSIMKYSMVNFTFTLLKRVITLKALPLLGVGPFQDKYICTFFGVR